MKKAAIFISLLLVSIFAFSNLQVAGNDSTTTTTTTQEETQQTYWFEGKQYVYVSYQDLINQIHADISADLTAQITEELTTILTQAYYDQIYASVEADFDNLLTNAEIELYIAEFQNQLYDVIDVGENSVFGIINYNSEDEISVGSGVVYKYDQAFDLYYLITNHHVIEDSVRVEISFSDESVVTANVLGYDTEVDIAILTFSGNNAPDNIVVSVLGDSDLLDRSNYVLAIGNPIGFAFYNSVTLGIVAGLDREVDQNRYVKYIHHDAAINGGNSGGPIYNIDGEVIGINVSKFANDEVEGMGFAIPINLVKRIIERVEELDLEQHTIMPRIGCEYLYFDEELIDEGQVFIDVLTVEDGTRYNIDVILPEGITNGIIVREVETNGTLDGYLTNGDLIYRIDNFVVTDEESFFDYIYENYESGDMAVIYYYDFDSTGNEYLEGIQYSTITFK